MFYCYILFSLKDGKLYKGFSADIAKRFLKHAAGGTPSTKNRQPLVLIYTEQFLTKNEAINRERFFKSREGGLLLLDILVEKNILNNDRSLKLNLT